MISLMALCKSKPAPVVTRKRRLHERRRMLPRSPRSSAAESSVAAACARHTSLAWREPATRLLPCCSAADMVTLAPEKAVRRELGSIALVLVLLAEVAIALPDASACAPRKTPFMLPRCCCCNREQVAPECSRLMVFFRIFFSWCGSRFSMYDLLSALAPHSSHAKGRRKCLRRLQTFSFQ